MAGLSDALERKSILLSCDGSDTRRDFHAILTQGAMVAPNYR